MKAYIPYLLPVASIFGFADALYLTYSRFNGIPISCSIGGCHDVLNSTYAFIYGIPISLFGIPHYGLFFITSIVLIILLQKNHSILQKLSLLLLVWSAVAFMSTLYLVFLQLFVIKAICLYCMGSAIISTILFWVSYYIYEQLRKSERSV